MAIHGRCLGRLLESISTRRGPRVSGKAGGSGEAYGPVMDRAEIPILQDNLRHPHHVGDVMRTAGSTGAG